jgi:hypothetical protein
MFNIQHLFKTINQPDAAISQVYYFSFKYSSTLMNKFQQDAANRVYFSLLFCSTCSGRYIHPSSGVSTVQAGMV